MSDNKKIFEIIDLSPYFNNDGISYDTNRSDGDFDGHDLTFPAEELPASHAIVTLEGIDFLFPDKSDGRANNVMFTGQLLHVPANLYTHLHVLGASDYGSFEEEITLQYEGDHWEKVSLGLTCCNAHFEPLFGEKPAIRCSGYHSPERDAHSEKGNLDWWIWLQTVQVDPRRKLVGIHLVDNPSMHSFAMTLRLTR